MYELASTLLLLTRDAEASALLLGKYLEIIRIQTKVAHGSMVKDEDMDREHRKVWVAIQNEVELSHKSAGKTTVTTLKTQVLKIESFTLKNGVHSTGVHQLY